MHPSDENASDIGVSLWPSRSEGESQRLHGVASVRSLTCTARPMITFITSFELQMHPNVSKNFMWLTFTPSLDSLAFVNGVEIVSIPDGFYTKGGFDDKITNVGSSIDFELDGKITLETVYRLNVGGDMVSVVNDTEMFQQWFSDDDFLLRENSRIIPMVASVKQNYTEKTLAYVAPYDVYKMSRTMGNVNNPRLNQNFNLTWHFPVEAGFNYLVRLHFCETLAEVNGPGQRVFTIFIRNQIAKLEMDVIGMSGDSRIPMYLDFSVYVGSESGLRPDLRLDLHPSTEIAPKYYDAILNGVEILKLINDDGSKRAIVYEFLENGSLDQFISRKKPLALDVTTLYGIALGVARGLEYLHYGCKSRIVHFDIKPQNILLDGNLCPKISDFGLAKLCEKRESIVSLIDTRGTIGYIAPEMLGARSKEIVETMASNAT
ncbi:hypothetical protein F2Q69_00016253 [Brassica cretica]|uniref:non-specific serine/threonine protein kinase n=1 Tax=Brassica cretica TaxID=69181 RepID=A0A8S9R4R8_BRACR|nr:hypothetical protein F2Q69_00016253 [Brassica cretica]